MTGHHAGLAVVVTAVVTVDNLVVVNSGKTVAVDKLVAHNYLRAGEEYILLPEKSSLAMDQVEAILLAEKEYILEWFWPSVDQVKVVVRPIPGRGQDRRPVRHKQGSA